MMMMMMMSMIKKPAFLDWDRAGNEEKKTFLAHISFFSFATVCYANMQIAYLSQEFIPWERVCGSACLFSQVGTVGLGDPRRFRHMFKQKP